MLFFYARKRGGMVRKILRRSGQSVEQLLRVSVAVMSVAQVGPYRSGKLPSRARANSVFPQPGTPAISTL